jgi:site-specific DNA-methyltransferase (adenine-specific)
MGPHFRFPPGLFPDSYLVLLPAPLHLRVVVVKERYAAVAPLDAAVMSPTARIPDVLAPPSMDPVGLQRLAPVPPALLDAGADRPQTGDVPRTVYEDTLARVLRGDSARLLEAIGEAGVNLIVTSPPYALGIDYGKTGYADDQPYAAYLDWVATWATALLDVSAPGGRACINIPLDSNKGGKRAIYADYLRIFQAAGWVYQTSIVWNEQNISRRTAWGSWLSPSAPFVTAPVEMIAVFYKGSYRRPATATRRGDITRDEFLAWTLGMWTFAGANPRRVGHPAPFPEELPRRLIKLYSYPDDIVLDPFSGSGTTLVAAKRLGRGSLGVEINPIFCDLTVRNLQNVELAAAS